MFSDPVQRMSGKEQGGAGTQLEEGQWVDTKAGATVRGGRGTQRIKPPWPFARGQ